MSHSLITQHLDLWTGAVTRKANGRGNNGSGDYELTGIQKLRELILELAVRGKLVEQDPSDEPASELLKRIEEEKQRLVDEGKIKKPKKLPEVTEEEKPFEVPEGWRWTRLEIIAQINPRNNADDHIEASFIPMPLVTDSYKGEHGQEVRKWSEIKKGYTHFAEGDIGLAKITPCFENSKAAVFKHLKNGIGAGTTELHVARPYNETVEPLFILLCLKSPGFLQKGEQKMTGSAGQKRVPKQFFSENPLPLPPLPEQHRIVQKIDELMALCDRLDQQTADQLAAHETLVDTLLDTLTRSADAAELAENWSRLEASFDTLFTTEHSIDRLKETILQLAVMGKLVEQDPEDEPATELLKRIEEEKQRLVDEGKIKKPKKLPEVAEEEKPFEVPEGWEWCRFQSVIDVRDGTHDSPKDAAGPNTYPLVTSKDFKNGEIDFSKARRISAEDHFKISQRSSVDYDDILFSMIGGNIGNQVIVKDSQPFSIKNVALFKYYNKSLTYPHYVKLFTEDLARSLQEKARGGAQPFISLGALRKLLFPLPPYSEQKRIVQKVDELMALCDRLKARLAEAGELMVQLAETIVEDGV